jgi:phosphoribosyl 1,2-cyclic phosphodiesterase
VKLADIDGVILTHAHGDHVDATTTYPICFRNRIPLFAHRGTVPDVLKRSNKFQNLIKEGLLVAFDAEFTVGKLRVRPYTVSHGNGWNEDVVGVPVGYIIEEAAEESPRRVAYTTDLGYMPDDFAEALTGVDALVIESNHDIKMEKSSRRPDFLVQWVMGPRGHLSNDQAAGALAYILSRGEGRTKNIILAHLSEDCNTPNLALETSRQRLLSLGYDVDITTAKQRELSRIVEV